MVGGAIKEFFKWNYNETIVLCDVIIQYIMKNGCGQSINWRKIEKEENQYVKKFRDKGVSSLIKEKWKHIYGGTYATGENVYVPTMQPPIINVEGQGEGHESENHMKARLGEEDNLYMYNLQDNPYFQSVLTDEDQFFTDFVKYVSNGNDDNTEAKSEDGPFQVNNQLLNTQLASQVRTDKNLSRRA
ncbi:hypothetical protein Cgig2_009357 [Carnegiea gigantea]|uniref:Uncharacterized protein n=1 Tax=Carnegiea gigantea TaxID=171969 RepID=A0A9Q1GPK6_9CARY|nr:hypothetical protein Cgig2_009357 [Carnegiea gigantea]